MTVYKLVSIVDASIVVDGDARRSEVQERYGLGFEGAIRDALRQEFVALEVGGQRIRLTDAGRRIVRNQVIINGLRRGVSFE